MLLTRARQREAWQHTAWLAALIANCNRDPKKRPQPFVPDDFNPLVERKAHPPGAIVVTKENIEDMRLAFSGLRPGGRP